MIYSIMMRNFFFTFLKRGRVLSPSRRGWTLTRGNLSPTTVRKFIYIRLISPGSIKITPLEWRKKLEECFTVRILLLKENPSMGYTDVEIGIFSPNASKHTAAEKLKLVLSEFPDPYISFKKGWGAVASHFVGVDSSKQVAIFGASSLGETLSVTRTHRKQLAARRGDRPWPIRFPARFFSFRNTLLACLVFQVVNNLLLWQFPPLVDIIFDTVNIHIDEYLEYMNECLQYLYRSIKDLWWGAEPVPSSTPPEANKSESQKVVEGFVIFVGPFVALYGVSLIISLFK